MSMNPYANLSETELDREIAARLGWVLDDTTPIKPFWRTELGKIRKFFVEDWNPSHPDSNQVQRYVLPKLEAMMKSAGAEHVAIMCRKEGTIFKCFIDYTAPIKTIIPAKEDWRISEAVCVSGWEDPKINRCKLIAALLTLDKLEEMEKK